MKKHVRNIGAAILVLCSAGALFAAAGDPYKTEREAVNAALAEAAGRTQQDNNEYGTIIYQTGTGDNATYSYTPLVQGSCDQNGNCGVAPTTAAVPDDGTVLAQAHSHPEDGTAGPLDNSNTKYGMYTEDFDGSRTQYDPGDHTGTDIGPLSDDPVDGVLPPSFTDTGSEYGSES